MTYSDLGQQAARYLERLIEAGSPTARFRVQSMLDITVPADWGRRGAFTIEDCHLLYVRGGRPIYRVDEREMLLGEGDVLFAGRGTRIELSQDRSAPPQIVPVRFDRYLGEAPCALHGAPNRGAIALRPQYPERLEAMFDQLHVAWLDDRELLASEAVTGLVTAILWSLMLECRNPALHGRPRDPWLETARLRLEREPEANWSIADLAEQANLSESYFSRRFHEYTGVAPKVYQLHARMRYAWFLLEQEGMSVKEVAERLGYSDAFVFSRQFRKLWHRPPSSLRH